MRVKIKSFLTLFLVLLVQNLIAQERIVSGKVTDTNGLPLPGVSVVEKGTTNGSQTDFDGNYKVKVSPSATLVYTFIGMKTQELRANATVLNVKLEEEARVLEGVVVTALGITRDKKSLGYASQKLDGEAVNSSPTVNFVNNLAGKVAGLDVKINSNFGGSTNIVLRGAKSITGNNQALIVVDGIPISNANLNSKDAVNGRDGYDFGNAAADIDPNNIESINVLKGAAATALYGSLAQQGAIMITTKKGKKNSEIGISTSSTVSVGYYDKSTFPKYQTEYGQGYAGEDSIYSADVNGDGIPDLVASTGDDASYGNAFDPSLMVYQWDAFVPGNPNFGKATPWVAASNNPGTFFQNSTSYVNNVSLNGGNSDSAFNLSYTNNSETGIMPNSKLIKNTISGNYTRDLNDKIKVNSFMTFTHQSVTGRNSVGYGDNILTGFRQWWPVNVDMQALRSEYFRTRSNVSWNQIDPTNGDLRPNFWNNPYFDRYENFTSDNRKRLLTGASISFDITKNFNLLGRVGIDYSYDKQELRKAIGSHAEEFGITQSTNQATESSGYVMYTRDFLQQNYDIIGTYDFSLGSDVSAKVIGGFNFIRADVYSFEGATAGGLLVPGIYSLSNSKVFIPPIESTIPYEKAGVYAQANIDYKKMVYLEGSFRHDESTALPKSSRGYDYYSAGTSIIVSEMLKADWLSFAKLRLNYARVGNDPVYGRLGAKQNNGSINNNPIFGNSDQLIEFEKLRPEITHSWELGIEASLFKNRLSLDASVYKTNTKDQIFFVPQSPSTQYISKQINAGELENKGIEVALSATPIKTTDFSWQINVNWSKNVNKLLSLDSGRTNLLLTTFQRTSLNATVGEPYGTIRGTDYVYDANGNPVVGDDGLYLTNPDQVLGNIQPDWIGGVSNKVTYKNLSLSFLINVRQGGSIFSLDQAYGQETGLYPETAGLNDLGNPVRSPLSQGGGIILPGVKEDGTPNDIRVDATASANVFGGDSNPEKAFVYDASFVKLREVALNYTMPSKLLGHSFIKGVSFSLIGNNLWIIQKHTPYADPEAGSSGGNIQGYQSGVMPSIRVYSFNVKLNF